MMLRCAALCVLQRKKSSPAWLASIQGLGLADPHDVAKLDRKQQFAPFVLDAGSRRHPMRHSDQVAKSDRRSGGFRSFLPSLLTQAVPAKHARRSARAISEAAGNGFPHSHGPGPKCMPLANRSSSAYGPRVGRRRARALAAHPLLAGLLFLIFLLKTIPAGYMLVASDDGWPRLALCSGVAALSGKEGHAKASRQSRRPRTSVCVLPFANVSGDPEQG